MEAADELKRAGASEPGCGWTPEIEAGSREMTREAVLVKRGRFLLLSKGRNGNFLRAAPPLTTRSDGRLQLDKPRQGTRHPGAISTFHFQLLS